MGNVLPGPVLCTVIERHGTKSFHVGLAELNGYRTNMEDAHVVHCKEDWGFFGVFDGHSGDKCSKYVAEAMKKSLNSKGCPADDAAVKKLVLDIDDEFLKSGEDGGSTGTMCIVHKPKSGGKHQLRIINCGDSRVILGRRDGTIVDGGGTDFGLTIDHKPDNAIEKERIYRCGGTVEMAMGGVARVNGDLAVSRAFGDANYKKTGGPAPEDRPVTADPELGNFECDEADFVLLVCDGVSEGRFSNAEVVELVANTLRESTDPGEAARLVVLKAVEMGSKDNVTCMVVLLTPAPEDQRVSGTEYAPGSLTHARNDGFRKAYKAMAERAGKTFGEAAKIRYGIVQEKLASSATSEDERKDLQKELAEIGPPDGQEVNDTWFESLEENLSKGGDAPRGPPGLAPELLQLVQSGALPPSALMSLAGRGPVDDEDDGIRTVRVVETAELKKAVEKSDALHWDARMEQLGGSVGQVKKDDPSDGTSQVRFKDLGMVAWLPTSALMEVEDSS